MRMIACGISRFKMVLWELSLNGTLRRCKQFRVLMERKLPFSFMLHSDQAVIHPVPLLLIHPTPIIHDSKMRLLTEAKEVNVVLHVSEVPQAGDVGVLGTIGIAAHPHQITGIEITDLVTHENADLPMHPQTTVATTVHLREIREIEVLVLNAIASIETEKDLIPE